MPPAPATFKNHQQTIKNNKKHIQISFSDFLELFPNVMHFDEARLLPRSGSHVVHQNVWKPLRKHSCSIGPKHQKKYFLSVFWFCHVFDSFLMVSESLKGSRGIQNRVPGASRIPYGFILIDLGPI